jgi:hypothetical protein
MPVHSAEHDAALAHLIALKKQHRKQGMLSAMKEQLLIRSRAIDILEVFLTAQ